MTGTIARSAVLAALLFATAQGRKTDLQAHIHGTVTNFANEPLAGAEVMLKRDDFSDAARVAADSQGRYSMLVPAGYYNALCAVRDYQVKNLEFWAWDVQAQGDVTIDCRVDGLELYGIHAWRPRGAAPSYLVYVQPMSLQRCGKFIQEHGPNALNTSAVVAISPELAAQDITAQIDGQPVPVLTVSRVAESAGPGRTMYGWLIQVGLPAKSGTAVPSRLSLELTDRETGERGAGCVFLDAGQK
jgi:hypothetical protein